MISRRQSLIVLAAMLLALVSAPLIRAEEKGKMPASDPFGRFTVDQVERRLGQAHVHLFDDNPPDVYAKNHLAGAVRMDAKDIKEGVLPGDKDDTLIFYCMNEL